MTPTITSLMKVAAALGKSVGYFIEESDRPAGHVGPGDQRTRCTPPRRGSSSTTSPGATGRSSSPGGGRRRALGRQRPAAMVHPGEELVLCSRAPGRSRSTPSRTSSRRATRSTSGPPTRTRVGQPVGLPGPGDLAGDPQLLTASGGVACGSSSRSAAMPDPRGRARDVAEQRPTRRGGARDPRSPAPTRSSSRTATARRSGRWRLQQCERRAGRAGAAARRPRRDDPGQIGYLLQQRSAPSTRRCRRPRSSPRSRVDPEDPAFRPADQADRPVLRRADGAAPRGERGWEVAPDAGRGWRRMVPARTRSRSSRLQRDRGRSAPALLVIAGGGGGIPVSAAPAGRPDRRRHRQGPRAAGSRRHRRRAPGARHGRPAVMLGFGTPLARIVG